MNGSMTRTLVAGFAMLMGALTINDAASAADASSPTPAAAIGAQDPPLCADAAYLKKIKTQYSDAEMLRENLTIKDLKDIKELHFGPSPHSVNQYATKTSYGVNSRYCQASATLSDGKADTVYWRMDYLVDGGDHSIQYDHCSLKHDTFKDRCIDYREGK